MGEWALRDCLRFAPAILQRDEDNLRHVMGAAGFEPATPCL